MVDIIWAQSAVDSMNSIYDYIGQDSVVYAKKVVFGIKNETSRLRQFPQLGRIVPEYQEEGLRELIYGSYRIIYKLQNSKTIIIAAVIHGSRLL